VDAVDVGAQQRVERLAIAPLRVAEEMGFVPLDARRVMG
jgi:hypothetical protein